MDLANDNLEENSLKLFPYCEENAGMWDEFLASTPMATFLQTRRYLSYHAERFEDVSLIIKDRKNRLVGLFPAAVDPSDSKRVVSHPGITYGGLLHAGNLRGAKMLEAFSSLRNYYANYGFEVLRYKVVPYIYHQVPAADDLYALFRMGAVRYRCDLSCAIDLTNQPEPSQRRKRGLKKALEKQIKVDFGSEFAWHLWSVIEDNLSRKYGVKPVHSVKEIIQLHSLFPNNIEFIVGLDENQLLGGVVLFLSPQVVHAQYIASSSTGYQLGVLDAIFQKCIDKAKDMGKRYFSFGISTENDGKYLNINLYQFKSEFGASGVVHEFYDMNLRG